MIKNHKNCENVRKCKKTTTLMLAPASSTYTALWAWDINLAMVYFQKRQSPSSSILQGLQQDITNSHGIHENDPAQLTWG